MNIAILGCGISGMVAAHACAVRLLEFEPRILIYSNRTEPSTMYGAQYLHAPIPALPGKLEKFRVKYLLQGTHQQYRHKVYGDDWQGRVSPEDLLGEHDGWDIRQAYEALWDRYRWCIRHLEITKHNLGSLLGSHDAVINTIPLTALCTEGHQFQATRIWAAGDAPDLGIDIGSQFAPIPNNTVLCNGDIAPSWYRMSRIAGHTTVEWPESSKPPLRTVSLVSKPVKNQCSCWPTMIRAGRYGTWTKGVLSHQVFNQVIEGMSAHASSD